MLVSVGKKYHLRKSDALDLVEKFHISLPSAYRHLAKGTVPASERRLGRDGRRYPAGKPRVEPVNRDLKLAWSALNRARQDKANDLDLIQRIWGLAAVMMGEAI